MIALLLFTTGLSLVNCSGGGGAPGAPGSLNTPPSPPVNVSALPGVQKSTVSWSTVTGATSYNIYYANSTGVTKATGTTISGVASPPYQHLHLNAYTYYYVVTAVNANGESTESGEVSAPVNLLVFVTKTTGTANLGSWPDAGGKTGLAAGDAICQARAAAAGLTGTFKVWLSDDTTDAYCHIHNLTGKKSANCGQTTLPVTAGPWIRTDGYPFSGTIDKILTYSGQIYTPVRFDEYGSLVYLPPTNYFTGTDPDGVLTLTSCSNWTNVNTMTAFGDVNATTAGWTYLMSTSCAATARLLCMQTGAGVPLPAFQSAGKKVFMTSVIGNGNMSSWPGAGGKSGLLAADSVCQTRAIASGVTGTFKAWLSDGYTNAINRFNSNGPWVRLDGVKVADNKTDLADRSIFTSINLTELGAYIGGNWPVWTGSDDNGLATAATVCNNWTDATASFSGTMGYPNHAGDGWSYFSGNTMQCSYTSGHLYCFED